MQAKWAKYLVETPRYTCAYTPKKETRHCFSAYQHEYQWQNKATVKQATVILHSLYNHFSISSRCASHPGLNDMDILLISLRERHSKQKPCVLFQRTHIRRRFPCDHWNNSLTTALNNVYTQRVVMETLLLPTSFAFIRAVSVAASRPTTVALICKMAGPFGRPLKTSPIRRVFRNRREAQ